MGSQGKLLEAVVIGSGFGGAISCCRLAQKWKDQVMLLERGKRYPMGSFPRSPQEISNNFWNPPGDKAKRPKHIHQKNTNGMFDIQNFPRMDTMVCAGLGGGSLIYANVFLEPPEQVFALGWPQGIDKAFLQPYFSVAKSVLGARPIPDWSTDPRRHIIRTELFQQFAKDQGRVSSLLDLNVFFGNDFNQATPIGIQEKNRYGATQTSCTYCAECFVGCNTHSKNTLDLNYLYVAEHVHKAKIQTESIVEKIVPLDEHGEVDASAGGEHGYRVYYRHLNENAMHVDARRVVVSAGTLGTNELLLRCRDIHRTLPRLSPRLGQRFSGNGDFLSFVVDGEKPADPNYGPVITQFSDYNLYQKHDPEHAYIMEDAGYPAFVAWAIAGLQPSVNPFGFIKKVILVLIMLWNHFWKSITDGKWSGSLGYVFHQILKGDVNFKTTMLLCMGLDKGNGELRLRDGNLDMTWPQQSNMPLYDAILNTGRKFTKFVKSCWYIPFPTWYWPMRNNVTVHPLGGCILADNPEQGVTSANAHDRGQVFGYKGLYVADGSLLPSAVGSNPIATISAVSEWVAQGITGNQNLPTDDIGKTIP